MEVSINISCSAKTAAVPVICYVYTTGPQCDKTVQGPQGVKIYNGCTAICKTTPVSKGFYPNHQHLSLYTKMPTTRGQTGVTRDKLLSNLGIYP